MTPRLRKSQFGIIPAMLFLGLVMMPFYYVCKTHSLPGYLNLRCGGQASNNLRVDRSGRIALCQYFLRG